MASLSSDSSPRLPEGHHALRGRVPFAALPVPDVAWARGEAGLLGWGVEDERVAWAPQDVRAALARVLSERSGPWLGGWAFDLARSPEGAWSGWPLLRFIRPSVVLRYGPTGATLAAAPGSEHRAEQLRRAWESAPAAPAVATFVPPWPSGDPAAWISLHARALRVLGEGRLEKVVLARAVTAPFRGSLPEVFAALARENPGARSFLVRNGTAVFLGATPETLCHVRGLALETEALAGTARPGAADALLGSGKDRREHQVVVEAIRAALAAHADGVDIPAEPEVVTLPNVVHLRTPIRARLRSVSALADLVPVLHPTPAVNGAPRDEAQAFLRDHEGLERGWFAGGVGCVEPGHVELRVALRSALVTGDRVHAFAGAGVVVGSEAIAEWEETARKLTTVQAAFEEAARG
ncbi:MAG: isochorismate synthase [Pseudomonadota bacterium]